MCPCKRQHQRGLVMLAGLVSLFLAPCLAAHPADITPLRIQIQPQRVDLRFTLTLLTLGRMANLDPDGDHQLSPQELEASQGPMMAFLREHVLLKINDHPVTLGELVRFDPLWPPTPSVDLREVDRAVDVTFQLTSEEVVANLWMEFTGFPQLGEAASIQATYEQGELLTQVPFTPGEPDYLYDTGFAVESLFQPTAAPAPSVPASPAWTVRVLAGVMGLLFLIITWNLVKTFAGLVRKRRKGDPPSSP